MSSHGSAGDKKYEEQKDFTAGLMLLATTKNGKICSLNRNLFERELQRIETGIQQLESKIGQLNDWKSPGKKLKELRAEKEEAFKKEKTVVEELATLSPVINTKRDQMMHIQGQLQYKQEDKIAEAIYRLEVQLRNHNFSLREEKKIVAEIDKLNRSRRVLREFMKYKDEVDALREQQKKMREKRDILYQQVTRIRTEEQEMKKRAEDNRKEMELLKKELNALYSEKKSIAEEFHRAYVLYQQYRRERRKERRQKQQAQIQARHQKCQYEDVAIPEPYEKERGFCKTLLSYLGKFDVNASGSASGSLLLCPNDAHPPLRLSVSQDSGFQLLKGRKADTEEDVKYSPVVVKARKKSRQERRVSIKNRPLSHTPEALQLFDQLGVSPPTLVSDVSAAVEQISSLLHDYQKLTESEKPMMPNGDCGTVQEMHEANGMKSKNGQSGDIQELCPVFMSYKSPEKRQNQSSCHEAIDSDKILANYVTQTSGRTVHCHQSQQPDMIPVPLTDTKTAMFQAPDEEPMMGISLMSLSIISQVDGLEPQTGSVSAISRTNDKQQMTESMTNFPVIQQNQLVASGGAVSQAGDEVSKHMYPQKVSLISSNCTKTSFSYFKTSGPSPYFDPCNVPVEVLEDFLGEPILNIINNQSHAEDAVCTDAASVEVLKKYIVPLPYVMDLMSGSDSVYDSEAVGSLISGRLVMSASCPQLNGEMASDFDTYLSSPLLMSRQTEPIVKEALLSSSGTHSA